MIKDNLDLMTVKKPKIERKEVIYLTDEELNKFINAIKSDNSKGRDIRKFRFLALTIFLLQTGARIGEVLSIKIDDIDRDNMEVNIIGKGNKPRTLFLINETLKFLDEYLDMRTDDNEYLFVTLDGQSKWRQTDVGRSLRRYKKLSGISKKFTLHTLRHTFATKHVLRGTPMNVVQHCLGHSNLETTMKYYIGAADKQQAKQFINDSHFDFIE